MIVAFGVVSLEALAWVAYYSRDYLSKIIHFPINPSESYKIAASDINGHWRLRPNYNATHDEIVAEKKASNKWLGVKAIEQIDAHKRNENGLSINAHGFRGPKIDENHLCPRILTIGDSVTFGIGSLTYPQFMREYFNSQNVGVEVINAGVEGYSPKNALYEVETYKALKPEIVTIYIGWNALFSLHKGDYSEQPISKIPWLLHRVSYVFEQLFDDTYAKASHAYSRPLTPVQSDPDIGFWSGINPIFMNDIDLLIKEMKSSGAQVYLVSLFGLFQSDQIPNKKALDIGHLPLETDNPYVLAAMTNAFNEHLYTLSQSNNVKYIDLYKWGRQNLKPIDDYFFDSVHLNAKGLERVGHYIALEILKSNKLVHNNCAVAR